MGKFRYEGSIRKCIFEGCTNTSLNSPEKIFLSCPKSLEKRKLWFQAAGKTKILRSKAYYCCEDHFNLEEDALNWAYFKFMGHRIWLKEGVIPRKKTGTDLPPQFSSEDHKRKLERLEQFASSVEEEEESPNEETSRSVSSNVRTVQEASTIKNEEDSTSELKERDANLERCFKEESNNSIKVEVDEDIAIEYNNIKEEFYTQSGDAEILPTISEAISKVSEDILEINKILTKTKEKTCINGTQSRFVKPEQGLDLIRKGLELLQDWTLEMDAERQMETLTQFKSNEVLKTAETRWFQ